MAKILIELKECVTAPRVVMNRVGIGLAQKPVPFEQRPEHVMAKAIAMATEFSRHAARNGEELL